MQIYDGNYVFKFYLVGSPGTGKSNLLLRYCDDTFSEGTLNSIGVDFKIKIIIFNDEKIRLQIWDSPRRDRFYNYRTPYRGTLLVFLCYDITNKNTFDDIWKEWKNEIERYCRDDVLITLVGTKLDLVDLDGDKRQVSYETAKKFAEEMDWQFYEISSKYDYNIKECIMNATTRTYKRFILLENEFSNINNKTIMNNNNKKDCIIN